MLHINNKMPIILYKHIMSKNYLHYNNRPTKKIGDRLKIQKKDIYKEHDQKMNSM